MDKKVTKKGPKFDKSNLGGSFELDSNKGKKKKHKERKKKHETDKIFTSNEILKQNCTIETLERRTCSSEGDITFSRNGEGESNTKKRKKRKGGKDSEIVNGNIADNREMQFLDDNQQRKMKKRKIYDDSFAGMQETAASRPNKKGKATEDNEFKRNEGDSLLVMTGDANAHYLVTEVDCQGKKIEEKKKPSNKSKRIEKGYKNNECQHSVVIEVEGQGKMKMKKKLSKKSKRAEDKEYKSNQVDPCLAKSNVADHLLAESNEGDQHLAKRNEHEVGDQGKMMKKKKKLSNKRKSKENNESKSNEGDPPLARVETGDADARCIVSEVDDQGKKMKIKKKTKAGIGKSPNLAPGGTSKRVTFSDKVDVCCDGFVRGKRFTPEEDEKIKQAVYDYIESHGLGDEGLDMILHCKSHPEIRDCWKEIGAVFPERHYHSVYYRAHILFERDEKRKWTPEEYEFIRNVQEQHGSDWKMMAEALGKNRFHVKDAWRRIKIANTNKGRWSQEEYQNLFDLVNLDLRMRASEDCRKSKHGMLRDNIGWEAIGNKLATRTSARCCKKWYEQLTSPMIAQGTWSDTDDYRLLNALFTLDACCMEEVDWDNLLEHRSGDVCRKRWNQMIQHIGEHGEKSFAEQVEILSKRFCPDLLEAREAFDSKPVVC